MTDRAGEPGAPSLPEAGARWTLTRPELVAALGAAGLGLGGVVVGLAGDVMLFAFALMGALGAASLWTLLGDWRGRILLLLAGTLGFFIGFTVPFFIVLAVWEPPSRALQFGLIGVIGGALGGAALGGGLRSLKTTGWLALAGAAGFGGGLAAMGQPGFHPVLVFGLPALVTGAGMGFLAASRGRSGTP
jgi:hypothetical protein